MRHNDTGDALKASAKEAYDRTMAALNAELRSAREAARRRVSEQREACGREVRDAQNVVAEKRKSCKVSLGAERERGRSEIQIVADKVRAERAFRLEIQRIERWGEMRQRPEMSGRELIAHRIDLLEREIMAVEPRLMPYWRRVKDKRAFVSLESRASAFERLVEAVEAEVGEQGVGRYVGDDVDLYMAEFEREARKRGYEEVPF